MKRIRATAVVVKDEQILLVHRHKYGNEYHILPGGDVEQGETIEAAVLRELREEASLEATIEEKVYSYWHQDTHNHLYRCTHTAGEIALALDSEEAQLMSLHNRFTPTWVPIHTLPSLSFYSKQTKDFLLHYFNIA